MNVNDILNKALALLGIRDCVVAAGTTDQRLLDLVTALGVSYMRLVTEYAPLEREAEVTVSDGSFDASALAEPLFDAVRLADKAGRPVPFRLRGKTLLAKDGEYILRYYALPAAYPVIGGTVEVAPQIPLDLLARGVAAEYATAQMMYEESLLHERKYKEGLMKALSPRGTKRLPEGKRWI